MGVIVQFDYNAWISLFPQFSYVEAPIAALYFNAATNYCRNDGTGEVCDPAQQIWLLNLLVAHIAQLLGPSATGQGPSPLVGRINSATQGSVSVGSEFPMTPPGSWYQQTPYGAAYWEATKPFRTMRYIPGRVRRMAPWPFQ